MTSNKDDAALPQVFQRLGGSGIHNSNRARYSNPPQDFVRVANLKDANKKNEAEQEPTGEFPDYSSIAQMDKDALYYSPNNNQNNFPPAQQAPFNFSNKGSGQGFNFVKNKPLAVNTQPKTSSFSFVRDHKPHPMNGNNSFGFCINSPYQMNHGIGNMIPSSPQSPININGQHQYQQQQQQQHQWNNRDTIARVQNVDRSDNENHTQYVSTSPSSDLAKIIKIVASVQNDSIRNTDSDQRSDDEPAAPSRKVTLTSTKRDRSINGERSPIKKHKAISPSPPPAQGTERGLSPGRERDVRERRVHSSRRPRRQSVHNHDDSDEEKAPFLELKADFYRPNYVSDDNDDHVTRKSKTPPTKEQSSSKHEKNLKQTIPDSDKSHKPANNQIDTPGSSKKRKTIPIVFNEKDNVSNEDKTVKESTEKTSTNTSDSRKDFHDHPPLGANVPKLNNTESKTLKSTPLEAPKLRSPVSQSHNKVWIKPVVDKPVQTATADSLLVSEPLPLSKKFTPVANSTEKSVPSQEVNHKPAANISSNQFSTPSEPLHDGTKASEKSAPKSSSTLPKISSLANNSGNQRSASAKSVQQAVLANQKKSASNKNSTGVKEASVSHETTPKNSSKGKKPERHPSIEERDDVVMDLALASSTTSIERNKKVILNNKSRSEDVIMDDIQLKQEEVEQKSDFENLTPTSVEQNVVRKMAQLIKRESAPNNSVSTPTLDSLPSSPALTDSPSPKASTPSLSPPVSNTTNVTLQAVDNSCADDSQTTNSNEGSISDATKPKDTPSVPKKKSTSTRVSYPWKVLMADDGEVSYLNRVTGKIVSERPVE